jgi:hypothetical protein
MKILWMMAAISLAAGVTLSEAKTRASGPTFVGCYNDDSLDVINQDELRIPWWGGPAPIPAPADCAAGPSVVIDGSYSEARRVLVDGVVAYDSTIDPPAEARVAPTGFVAIRTERGSVFVYRNRLGLRTWFQAGARSVTAFRMSREGNLIAATDDGQLVIDGREQRSIEHVVALLASASCRLVALMSDGSLRDERGTLYQRSTDPAVAVKVAADGTVVWKTQEGRIGSTKDARLYDHSIDPAVSFKVNAAGHVAYLTQDGKLGRDGRELSNGFTRITQYRIQRDGAVSAVDADGRGHYYR